MTEEQIRDCPWLERTDEGVLILWDKLEEEIKDLPEYTKEEMIEWVDNAKYKK